MAQIYTVTTTGDTDTEGTFRYGVNHLTQRLYQIDFDDSIAGAEIVLLENLNFSQYAEVYGKNATISGSSISTMSDLLLSELNINLIDKTFAISFNAENAILSLAKVSIDMTASSYDKVCGIWADDVNSCSITTDQDFKLAITNKGPGEAYGFYSLSHAASSFISLGSVGGDIAVSSDGKAFGFYAGQFNVTFFLSALNGTMTVKGATGAYGVDIDSKDQALFNIFTFSGDMTMESGTDAYGIRVNSPVNSSATLYSFTGKMTVLAKTGFACGIQAKTNYGESAISLEQMFSTGILTVTGTTGARGFSAESKANASIEFSSLNSGTILQITAKDGDAYALYAHADEIKNGSTIQIKMSTCAGDITVSAEGRGSAYGFSSDYNNAATDQSQTPTKVYDTIAISSFSGNMTVTSLSGNAYGFYSVLDRTARINLGDFSGKLTVSAGGVKIIDGKETVFDGKEAYGAISSSLLLNSFSASASVEVKTIAYDAYGFRASAGFRLNGTFAGAISVSSEKASAAGIAVYSSIESTVTLGGFNGSMTVLGARGAGGIFGRTMTVGNFGASARIQISTANGTAYGFGFSGNAIGSDFKFGTFAAQMTVSTASGGDAMGFLTASENSTFAMTGISAAANISITSADAAAYGIYIYSSYSSRPTNLTLANISGTMTVSGKTAASVLEVFTDYLFNIGAISSNSGGAVKVDGTLVADSRLIWNGNTNAFCVLGTVGKNLNISGTLAAGNYTEGGASMDEVLANLKIARDDEQAYSVLADQSTGFAIFDGYRSNQTLISGYGEDNITISNTGLVLGSISLGGGTNSLTVHSGARIEGNIYASSLKLNFVLDSAPQTYSCLNLTQGVPELFSYGTQIKIDCTNSASGTYRLVDSAMAIPDLFTTIVWGTESENVFVGTEVVFEDGSRGKLVFRDETRKQLDFVFTSATQLTASLKVVNENQISVSWTGTPKDPASIQYEFRYGTSATNLDKTISVKNNPLSLDFLPDGTYFWQAKTSESTDWSGVSSFKIFTEAQIFASTTEPTNENVILTAQFAANAERKQYSFDQTNWLDYADGVVVEENSTVYFRSLDASGDASGIASYTVSNIDRAVPESPVLSVSTTEPTNQPVTITAVFASNIILKQYSFDGVTWNNFETDVILDSNATVLFRGMNGVGNYSEVVSIDVSNIDLIPPVISDITANTLVPTNQDVVLQAVFENPDSLVSMQYKIGEDGAWTDYTDGVTVTQNAVVFFRAVDAAGNETVNQFMVANIDKNAPVATDISANITVPTNQNVFVSATFTDDNPFVVLYSIDGGQAWNQYTSDIEMFENGIIDFKASDSFGNETLISFEVSNIDKIAPVISNLSANITEVTAQNVILTADFTDNMAVSAAQYKIGVDGEWLEYSADGVSIAENSTVFFRALDAAGNETVSEGFTVGNIDTAAPTIPSDLTVTVTDGSVLLDWSASVDSGIAGIAGYNLRYGKTKELSGEGSFVVDSEFTVSAPEWGTWYWQVQAQDAAGNKSGWTEVESFKIARPLDTPMNLTAKVKKYDCTLSWTKLASTQFTQIAYLVKVDGKEYLSKTNSLTLKSLSVGSHSYEVRAFDPLSGRESAWSGEQTFTVLDVTAPELGKIKADLTGYSLSVSWTDAKDNVGIDHYIVSCDGVQTVVEGSATAFVYETLAPGSHSIKVTAYDAANLASKTSSVKVSVKDVTAPDQVTGLRVLGSVTNKSKGVLTWDVPADNAGVSGYRIILSSGKEYKATKNELKLSVLPAGEYSYQVIAYDKAKNESLVSLEEKFSVADVIAPIVKKCTAKVTNQNVLLSWESVDESGALGSSKIVLDGALYQETNETSLLLTELGLGKHTVELYSQDLAGNMSSAKKVSLNITKLNPAVETPLLSMSTDLNLYSASRTQHSAMQLA